MKLTAKPRYEWTICLNQEEAEALMEICHFAQSGGQLPLSLQGAELAARLAGAVTGVSMEPEERSS